MVMSSARPAAGVRGLVTARAYDNIEMVHRMLMAILDLDHPEAICSLFAFSIYASTEEASSF